MRSLLHLVTFFVLSSFILAANASTAPCTLSKTNPSVTVCTPSKNALVQSPVYLVAGTTDSNNVTGMQVYVDNNPVYQTSASSLSTFLTLPVGSHSITVQGTDTTGASFQTNFTVAMQPPCELNSTNQTVTICSLVNGSIVSQPFHVVAAAADSNPVYTMTLFVDGVNQGAVSNSAILDFYLSNVALGAHSITVQAQDSAGASFNRALNITVTAASNGLSHIGHIIFYLQENRSFDSYFGLLGPYKAAEGLTNDVDGLHLSTTLPNKQGQPVHPYHYQTVCTENLGASWIPSHTDIDGGLMDGFMLTVPASSIDPTGTRAMGYYDQSDLPYYYEAAARFATSDRFFSPVTARTIPNRLYLFTGTSFGHTDKVAPPSGGFTQPTIFDRLTQAGISWRYYYQTSLSSAFITQFATYQQNSANQANVVPISNWFNDVNDDATLASVVFIERSDDEHPGNNVQHGAAQVAQIINALIHSPSWQDSVAILTYDEGGGLYDHVRPAREIEPDSIQPIQARGAFNQTGFRLPVIIFSPWAKPSFVSHTTRDFTSILRLIEDRFNLQPLTLRDANADDMLEFFDFSGSPPLGTPPTLPAQPTNGACDHNKEAAPGF